MSVREDNAGKGAPHAWRKEIYVSGTEIQGPLLVVNAGFYALSNFAYWGCRPEDDTSSRSQSVGAKPCNSAPIIRSANPLGDSRRQRTLDELSGGGNARIIKGFAEELCLSLTSVVDCLTVRSQ